MAHYLLFPLSLFLAFPKAKILTGGDCKQLQINYSMINADRTYPFGAQRKLYTSSGLDLAPILDWDWA
jgi:hypothetical protein